MTTLAIIGTGIAGLGCAHFLHQRFDLTLFEQNDYVGGHTNTVEADEGGKPIPIDTGFMVYNEVTYPNLTRLFRELQVAVKPTTMSFSVQHIPTGLEFCGSSINHLFAQRRNLLRPRFLIMLAKIDRFNKEAVDALNEHRFQNYTVQQYIEERQYGDDLLNLYLIPMSSAVWSTPPDKMLEFPAVTLLRFFYNHGFLGLYTQHPWLTVDQGAKSYVAKITAPFQKKIRVNQPVVRVTRTSNQVIVQTRDGVTQTFDKVIFACHGDQALRLLGDPTPNEQRLLSAFSYQPNLAVLHTDASLMPRRKLAWSSWNYRIEFDERGKVSPTTIYWMNSLQGVSDKRNYFVSINGEHRINPQHILKRIEYEHPLFSLKAMNAQLELPKLNQISPLQTTYFCGSYFKYGFHEDAFTSALELSRTITGKAIWK
ncbi:MAG: FAD-dependent oxidoreductase [Acidobacteria bacterium]|nr:FAD-dependent oxidoreductase [Acidobacteriota bacterium]